MKLIAKPIILALLSLIPLSALSVNAEPATGKALVTVHPEKPGVAIPADFLGFSIEKKILSIECFQPKNSVLINLFTNLGNGVLRIGANEGDSTFWSRTEMNPLSGMKTFGYTLKPLTIGPLSLNNLYGFSKQSGWRVLHGLNLGTYDPAMAADEVAYALQVGGSSVLAFEVGNEPNLYRKNATQEGLRPADYKYDQYRREIEGYYSAILAKTPRAPLGGPATTRFCNWLPDFVRDFKSKIKLVTSHGYALSGNEKDPQSIWFPSIENLMRPQKDKEQVWLPKLEAAKAAGIPCRFDEYNTCTGGGRPGVSDVFASALWNVDFMFAVAEQGGAGVNLHGGFGAKAGYSPFSYRNNRFFVNPIYYSMLMFHQAAQGRMVPVECQTPANFVAHAVLGDDRKLRVVLINKELTNSVVASIVTGLPNKKAQVIRLAAPSAASTEGVTLAGSAVAGDGTWKPLPGAPVSCVNGKFEVSLPAASAALLTIE
ncbi:MAG: glycosyl hydrolase family 79 C-terminal domain-containing protein [Verrucomicrobiota bacterium]